MNKIITCIICLSLLGLGVYLGYLLRQETEIKVNGIWLPQLSQVEKYQGRFICININEVKTLTELVKTCTHEAAHEVFARACENDIDKCLGELK